MDIGTRILNLIFERDITQKQLAEALNVAPTTINGYIKKGREPDIETLKQMADYFGVTVDYLIDYKSQAPSPNQLSQDEVNLIRLYRSLNNDQQEFLTEQTKFLIKQNTKKMLRSSDTTSKTGIGL